MIRNWLNTDVPTLAGALTPKLRQSRPRAAVALSLAGYSRQVVLRKAEIPLQATWTDHRVVVDDLLDRMAEQELLIGSSCFLPESVRGISATTKISSGRGLRDRQASMALLVRLFIGASSRA